MYILLRTTCFNITLVSSCFWLLLLLILNKTTGYGKEMIGVMTLILFHALDV